MKQSESRLLTILDPLRAGVVVLNAESEIVQMNRVAQELLGLSASVRLEDRSRLFRKLWPDGEEVPPEEWPSVLAARKTYVTRAEYQIVSRKRGGDLRVEISTAPLPDLAGRPGQTVAIFEDITHTRQAVELKNRLAAIVESSEDAIMGKDGDGIVTSWNRGAENVFGFTAEEMIGESIRKLLPEDRPHEEDDILLEIQSGRKVPPFETVRRKKDGTLIQVSLTVSPIRGTGGRIIGASQIAHDVTEQKQIQTQLRQSQKMEAIGQLTGGVAHDFNNILGVVIGSLDLLERQLEGNEPARSRVRTAQKAAARGADLARRLLAASSGGAFHPAWVDLSASLRNTVELGTRALGPEFSVELQVDREISPVFMDAAGFEVAMLNLLVNARDAMARGGTITIGARSTTVAGAGDGRQGSELKPGPYVCVCVTDAGEGMSREVQERAMEPFFTTKERGKGTGLGLSMVYGFFRQSGGTVHLQSKQDHGTTVSLYLPLRPVASGGDPDTPETVEVVARGTGTVLMVDDEADLLEIASAYLTEAGYEVLTAENVQSALGVLGAHPEVAILVTDVLMPGGRNGFDLAQAARGLRPGLPVMYCSGFPADSFAERKIVLDGPFLRKPYRSEELIATVRDTLLAGAGYAGESGAVGASRGIEPEPIPWAQTG